MEKTGLMEVVSKMFGGKDVAESAKELKIEEQRALEITPRVDDGPIGPMGSWF